MLNHIKEYLRNNSKGQAVVEVSLIVVLLIALVGAAVDWGLGLFVSHVVQNGVREGARKGVTLTTPVASSTVTNQVKLVIPDAPLFSSFRNNIRVTCDP